MIDVDANRLQVANQLGATALMIEAVGVPATFDICQSILAAGVRLANVGVHGKPVELHLEKLWDRNVSITTRLVATPPRSRCCSSSCNRES